MSDLIEALQETDKSLIRSIDAHLEPILLLEDIETGSIKSWIRQAVESLDDDAIKSGDYKKVIAPYLVKSKYAIIRFLDKKTDITNADALGELQDSLAEIAEDTNALLLPAYEPIPRDKLVHSINKINDALAPLNDDDAAKFVSNVGDADFNLTLYIAPETIDALITAETIESKMTMILKVKKPDFLGSSQWDFRYDSRTITAAIVDTDWLKLFQDGVVTVSPGDAIRATVLTQVQYGFDRDVVATHYTVIEVVGIIHKEKVHQPRLTD